MPILKYRDPTLGWQPLNLITAPPPTVQYFTASGTWTKDPTAQYIVVEVLGGGGAGGGAPAGAVGSHAMGTGGLSGGYAMSTLSVAALGTTETVTVGAAGAGAAGTTGGAGGNSSFGSWVVANGGPGGTAMGPSNLTYGGASTIFSTTGMVGDLIVPGQVGEMGWGTSDHSMGGMGGSSIYGAGGRGAAGAASTASVGSPGIGYGAGGGGSNSNNIASAAQAGGAGSAGLVIVTTYYGIGGAGGMTNPTYDTVNATTDVEVAGSSLPRGSQAGSNGFMQITATTTINVASPTFVQVPGLSPSLPMLSGRRYRVTVDGMCVSTVAGDRICIQLQMDGVVIKNAQLPAQATAGSAQAFSLSCIVNNPTSATHVFTTWMSRFTGTGTANISAAATTPCQIWVEDIGPA